MAAARRIIALPVETDQRRTLVEISRSRTEPANRVERARIILAYLAEPSTYAVARAMGAEPTDGDAVFAACRRTGNIGGAGRPRTHRMGCQDYGGGQNLAGRVGLREADAIRLPARTVDHPSAGSALRAITDRAGHPSLANLARGTVCKILAAHEVKPHRVRYYLERRDPEFEPKMAEVLCVYRGRDAAGGVGRSGTGARDHGDLL
jgi:hypothetical protein